MEGMFLLDSFFQIILVIFARAHELNCRSCWQSDEMKWREQAPVLFLLMLSSLLQTTIYASDILSSLKVECLLTSAIWSYGHEAEVYIFLNLPFPSNPKENSSIRCILSTPEQNLLWHIIGCTPNTFHNTINKNVNHSNDTIDNLNQSSFHKPACQCQGHLRTESLSASAHILHCGKIRPWVVRSGFRCASADLRQSRYLHVAR